MVGMTSLLRGLRNSVLIAAMAMATASIGCSSAGPSTPVQCDPDSSEPNDTEATAKELGELRDDPDSRGGIARLTIHSDSDTDWFKIPIRDTGLGGDPIITVAVDSTSFSVSNWFVCANKRRGDMACNVGSTANENASDGSQGCKGKDIEQGVDDLGAIAFERGNAVTSTTDCPSTSDDDGMLYIRVQRVSSFSNACSYDLEVSVR